jgi:predicted secreted protein
MAKVEIDESSAGTMVRLAPGDQAQLTLAETRTAGYAWRVVSPESPVLAVRDDGFTPATGVGGSGLHRWTITARKAGTATLGLEHGRSWESEAVKKFGVTLEVS